MATLQSTGIATGLDVESIVTSLMEIERAPVDRLESKQTIAEAQISAYGQLKSSVSDFQTAMSNLSSLSSFQTFGATSADESVFTATVDSAASAGNYTVEVVQLAERDKIATQGYTDSATTVGEGTLTLYSGADSFDVVIDSSNNTVAGIRDAINDASDNTGVTATIVNDDDGARLVLSTETGTENALKVTVSDSSDASNTDDSGLSALAYEAGVVVHRAEISTNLDAKVKIDGFTVTSSSNTVSGAIEGVDVTAVKIGTSSLTVARDDEAITASVEGFVSAFNALRSQINTQRDGQLEADSTLLAMERQLMSVLTSGSSITGSSFSYLVQAGISMDAEGVMSVDSDALTSALDSDFDSVANLFAAEDEGFAYRLEAIADGWLEDDGLIDARETGLQDQVDRIDDQIISIENRLVSVERRIRAQFTALETLVSELTNTGDYLTQQLAALTNN